MTAFGSWFGENNKQHDTKRVASTLDNILPVSEAPFLDGHRMRLLVLPSSVFRRKRPKYRFSIGQHETLRLEEPGGEGGARGLSLAGERALH